MLGQSTALDHAESFAHSVHFRDIRARGKQGLRDALHLVKPDQRQFEQRRAAAGNQQQYGVLHGQVLRQACLLYTSHQRGR